MSSSEPTDESTTTAPANSYHDEIGPEEAPSEAVVAAVAAMTDRPTAPGGTPASTSGDPLPPLFESINPDALDAVLDAPAVGSGDPEVTFSYCDHSVRVGDDFVTVSRIA
jgi:hypothetical protein